MNAKKIMGAVLVALLAAALFIGAGAAAGTNYGTVFESQNVSTFNVPLGEWFNGANVVVISADGIVGPVAVAGTYTKGEDSIYFTKPTATYTAIGNIGTTNYTIANGATVYQNSNLTLTIAALNNSVDVEYVLFTYPNGQVTNVSVNQFAKYQLNDLGTYKFQAIFNKSAFVDGVNNAILLDTLNAFTVTVVKADDATISASVDTAFSGEFVNVVVTGKPGETYGFNLTHVDVITYQYVNLTGSQPYVFTMPNNGEATFQMKINSSSANNAVVDADDDAAIIQLIYNGKVTKNGEIKIKISAPVVTATLGASSYFIGDNIKISGTSSAGTDYEFWISGTNFPVTALPINESAFGKEWEATLITKDVNASGKMLDVGTYSIYIVLKGTPQANVTKEAVKTVAVQLKQPFLSFTDAPEVITQQTEGIFIVNAEAATGIKAYVFGTNYFKEAPAALEDDDVKNVFEITLSKTMTEEMDAGQYFMVVQHPMYDGKFNIGVSGKTFYLNTSGDAVPVGPNSTKLFDVDLRQTANAAQALCDALETQNIDDMYVKVSFFIVGQDESFVINEIPSEVAQGSTFTVSGVDTANAGKTIQVTMLSTMFAAIPKEEAGSASFIVATTEIAEDGTWEVTIDTAGLAVDEYNLAVKIAGEENNKKNVKINVVEAADEPVDPEQPGDEPEQPGDEPVAPETPGFGALAALAGLGAVAVLLLRRE